MVNSKGYFPYYEIDEAVAEDTRPTTGGKWVRTDLIKSAELNVLSQAALENMADVLNRDSAPFRCSVLPYKDDFLPALFFSWLPPPLDTLVTGALCVLLVIVLIRLIAAIVDMIPFL